MLAQRNEIGGREIIDTSAFSRAAATDMAFLQPAIAALRSGDPDKLRTFDDLLFSPKYKDLRKMLGAKEPELNGGSADEFDELEDPPAEEPKQTSRKTKRPSEQPIPHDFDPPMEYPLDR